MNLQRLKEIDAQHTSALEPAAAASAINAMTTTKVVSRFASFRTLAAILTDAEYAEFKGTLTTQASQSAKVADMIEMLKLPGDSSGNGGGIDFGDATTRAMIDAYLPAMAAKLKGIAEVAEPLFPETVCDHNIEAARSI